MSNFLGETFQEEVLKKWNYRLHLQVITGNHIQESKITGKDQLESAYPRDRIGDVPINLFIIENGLPDRITDFMGFICSPHIGGLNLPQG